MAPPRPPRYALRAPAADLDTRHRGEPPDCGVFSAVCGGDGYDPAAALLVWVGDSGEDGADDVGCGVVVGFGVSVPQRRSSGCLGGCAGGGGKGLGIDVGNRGANCGVIGLCMLWSWGSVSCGFGRGSGGDVRNACGRNDRRGGRAGRAPKRKEDSLGMIIKIVERNIRGSLKKIGTFEIEAWTKRRYRLLATRRTPELRHNALLRDRSDPAQPIPYHPQARP